MSELLGFLFTCTWAWHAGRILLSAAIYLPPPTFHLLPLTSYLLSFPSHSPVYVMFPLTYSAFFCSSKASEIRFVEKGHIMKRVAIVGTGLPYLPRCIMTNFDIEKFLDTSDEWIYTRTGIKTRRIADKDWAVLRSIKDCL